MTLHFKVTTAYAASLQRGWLELKRGDKCRLHFTEEYRMRLMELTRYVIVKHLYGTEIDPELVKELSRLQYIDRGDLTPLGSQCIADLLWRMRYIPK